MLKVLIAEDEDRIRALLKMYFERESFFIKEANNGIDALEMALNEDFDLIILDVLMPGKDGFDVLKEIRMTKQTPIFFLTAKAEEKDLQKGFELGATDYVLKPFSPKQLVEKIQDYFQENS
jgi:two-component system, OmpR family, response regulator ResD